MATKKIVASKAKAQKIDAFQLKTSEARTRLAQHMSVLQGFGYTDLSKLGKLTIGTKGGQNLPILQKNGVLLPTAQGPFQEKLGTLSNESKSNAKAGLGGNVSGVALVTASKNLTMTVNNKVSTIPLNVAYWFGTQIDLQDDTTVVLAAEVKSLVIIAETLTIGKRVTITWDRPAEAMVATLPTHGPVLCAVSGHLTARAAYG